MTTRTERLAVTGGTLAYDRTGSTAPGARTLLLLHAFPVHRGLWDPQVEAFTGRSTGAPRYADELGVGEELSVLRFDARGFGGSSLPQGPLVMEQIADDAVELMRHLGVERAVVCGLSMGGYAALAMARRHPERLEALVLADTRAEDDTGDARSERGELAARVRREGTEPLAGELPEKLLGKTSLDRRPKVVERVQAMIREAGPEAVARALEGMALRPDSRPFLEDVEAPALVVCGEEDELTPVEAAEVLRDGIPGSRMKVLTGAGHLPSLETPDAFDRAVAEFLAGLPR